MNDVRNLKKIGAAPTTVEGVFDLLVIRMD